jgi:hypothetical protein
LPLASAPARRLESSCQFDCLPGRCGLLC